jgi:glycine dehydrogenase subunit 2
MTKTIFEKSQSKQHAYSLPKAAAAFSDFHPPKAYLRETDLPLPEISEIDLTRHFSGLAKRNMGIDTHFYPLGSCTMKLNPRVNEWCAQLPGFARTHPLAPAESVQGNLEMIYEFVGLLCQVCGMTAGSLVPNAGAQGELTGIQMIAAYHRENNDLERTELLIPDNAHGTNPATATMAGFKTIPIKTNAHGDLDIDHLRQLVSPKTAGLMLTNPNTLGLFSTVILEIAEIVHQAGGFLYYDGANLNSILNIVRPGEMGFDVMHVNLHKTFSTPHGGGGPGSGPVLCNDKLQPFLPVPRVIATQTKANEPSHYEVQWHASKSIGQVASFHGNFGIYLRAYLYAKLHGNFGLRRIAENAVLNANYLKKRLAPYFTIPFPQTCMHEFVVQVDKDLDKGIRALDFAKRLLDYSVHAPTVYFPLIIKECMLIEPTESESKSTLDQFVEVVQKIAQEIQENPALVKQAPHLQAVGRLDEVRAAKHPILKHP